MITCRELIDFLGDFVDGSLPEGERRAFEEHLAVCPECRQYVHSYRMTMELERRALSAGDEIPPEVPPSLVRAILAARNAVKP